MELDPATLAYQDVYKLIIGSVVPRPIAWVSSRAADGTLNLAPFSYFMAVSAAPPTLAVSVGYRREVLKDTWHNVEATGEFIVNVVSEEVAERMNVTSGNYSHDVDEFELAGLTPIAGAVVNVPRVAKSPISMECRVAQIVLVGEPPHGNALIIGRVVYFHVRDDVIENGRIDHGRLQAVGRLAGDWYTRTGDQFAMKRPP